MGQFSNSFPKHFSYLCEYAIRCDLSCSFCEYPFIFHCLHCSPSCFDPDSLLLAYLWLGLSWIDCISANKSFSSSKISSRKPYTSSKQQERHKHSVETTINFSLNNKTPALLQTAFCVYRLVYVPPCVCTAGPIMQVCNLGQFGGHQGGGGRKQGGGRKALMDHIYIYAGKRDGCGLGGN